MAYFTESERRQIDYIQGVLDDDYLDLDDDVLELYTRDLQQILVAGARRAKAEGGPSQPKGLIRVRLDGVESVVEHLRIIGDKELPRELRRMIREGLKPIHAAAKADAPVRSGKLRRSIRIYSQVKRAGIRVRTAPTRDLDYAGPIHWGWPGPDKEGRARNIPRNAFVWDNWKAGERQFHRDIDRQLEGWARRAERRLNRTVRVGASRVVT